MLLAVLAAVTSVLTASADTSAPDTPPVPALQAPVYAVLADLPPWHEDREEDAEYRAWRLGNAAHGIAQAVDLATCEGLWKGDEECTPAWPQDRRLELAALLVGIGWYESRYAAHVHEGRCRPEECDGGRARSPWQIQSSPMVPREEWQRMLGAEREPTVVASRAAARILAVFLDRCGTVEGSVAAYATGGRCTWSRAAERVLYARRVEGKLRAAIAD